MNREEQKRRYIAYRAAAHAACEGAPNLSVDPHGATVWMADGGAYVEARIWVPLSAIKCDGNHGGPKCKDPECWNQ